MTSKILMANPIVEIDGDEMTRILWQKIRQQLIEPHVELNSLYFDLSIQHREQTQDQITIEAADAVAQHHVGVKCATITPNQQRLEEYNLSQLWKSPNATIRNRVGGTIFRKPISCDNIPCLVRNWQQPIVVARHAHADQYKAIETKVSQGSTIKLTDGNELSQPLHHYTQPGIAMAMYNDIPSIESFARGVFQFGLTQQFPVYFSTKDTILKIYDGTFRDIFQRIYDEEFKASYQQANLSYQYRLIDDMVAFAIKSSGGFIWACKNYDGDVMSDMVAQGFGSLGLMTSELVTADGSTVLTEAAHGTVTRHFHQHQQGKATSTNPTALIMAWARALWYRGRFDQNSALIDFGEKLQQSTIEHIESGQLTKDLAMLTNTTQYVTSDQFISQLATRVNHAIH